MTEANGVRISQEKIYEEVVGLKDGFLRVEAKLDQHIALEEQRNAGIEERLQNHGTRLADHEIQLTGLDTRVTRLEFNDQADQTRTARKATWPQVVGVIFGSVTAVGALIALFITLTNIANALAP